MNNRTILQAKDVKEIKPIAKVCPGFLSSLVNKHGFTMGGKSGLKMTRIRQTVTIETGDVLSVDSEAEDTFLKQSRGSFNIFINNIQLTEVCLKYVQKELGSKCKARLCWKFAEFDKIFTSFEDCKEATIPFECEFIYKLVISEKLVDALRHKKVTFELFASNFEKQICIGKGRTDFSSAVEYPDTVHRIKVELFDYYKARQDDEKPRPCARADLEYKLVCDTEVLKTYRKKRVSLDGEKPSLMMEMNSVFAIEEEDRDVSSRGSKTVMPTDSEIYNFEEALDLVLTRNKALRTTQSEINMELKDRAQWLREEADWRRTLQEHAILSGKDPKEVKWRQWRDECTATVCIRSYPNFPPVYEPVFVIMIAQMNLFDDSPPMLDEEKTQFYVEYEFLDHTGPEMETPYSIKREPGSENFRFHFARKFCIDITKERNYCKQMSDFIKRNELLTFHIISEPEEKDSDSIQACEQIGFTELSIFELVQLEINLAAFWFDVINVKDEEEVIGYLKLQFEGIQAARRMALKMLAPKDYTIIQ